MHGTKQVLSETEDWCSMLGNVKKILQPSFGRHTKAIAKTNVVSKPGLLFSLIMSCLLLFSGSTEAVLIHFESFNSNGNYYNDPGLDIYVDVFEVSGRAYFEFHNESTFSSSIARIYFEDGGLDGIFDIENGIGTVFEENASPQNVPAGQTLDPVFVAAYGADSEPSTSHNGVNPGEKVGIILNLDAGTTFSEMFSQIEDGSVRIGLHVIALPDGSSFSMTTPEPATLLLLGLGAITLRRKGQKQSLTSHP